MADENLGAVEPGMFDQAREALADAGADAVTRQIDELRGDRGDQAVEFQPLAQDPRVAAQAGEQVGDIADEAQRGDIKQRLEQFGPRRGPPMRTEIDVLQRASPLARRRGLQAGDEIVDRRKPGDISRPWETSESTSLAGTASREGLASRSSAAVTAFAASGWGSLINRDIATIRAPISTARRPSPSLVRRPLI
ncbi:hypothetical protein NKJ32_19065 [Mesorhizobium sp. M0159]